MFNLLDKVNAITGRVPVESSNTNTAYSTPCTNTLTKSLNNFRTLSFGDLIIDNDGNRRYVVAVDHTNCKLILTGRKSNLSNYKRVFTWTSEKIEKAIRTKGFRVAN